MNDSNVLDETDELPSALAVPMSLAVSMARAEVDQQITTARAYPRSIKQVTDRIYSLATLDKESAEESMYALPRGGKPITGPSVRFAEIVKQSYGNCRAAARVVHVDRTEKFVEAEGIFHDLETNTATTARVRRRIVDSKGRLYSDDMIIVTGNAACSIALRNAIMGGVPKPLWRRAFEAVMATIKGDVTTLTENRTAALKAFAMFGVKPEQIFSALGLAGEPDITVEHIPLLRGMFATLKNGESTVEEMFGSPIAPSSAPQTLHAGFEDVKTGAKKPAKAKAPAAADPKNTQAPADPSPSEPEGAGETTDNGQTAAPEAEESRQGAEGTQDAANAEVITAGHAAKDEAYLHADFGFMEDGRRLTFKNGERFSSVKTQGDLNIYAEHAPELAADPEPETATDDTGGASDMAPELAGYIKTVEAAPTWVEVKKAMQAFYTTDFFKKLTPEKQNLIRGDTWDVVNEATYPDKPDHAADVSAFRLWIEWVEDPDAITGTLRTLELEPTFEQKPDDFKAAIRNAADIRCRALQST